MSATKGQYPLWTQMYAQSEGLQCPSARESRIAFASASISDGSSTQLVSLGAFKQRVRLAWESQFSCEFMFVRMQCCDSCLCTLPQLLIFDVLSVSRGQFQDDIWSATRRATFWPRASV